MSASFSANCGRPPRVFSIFTATAGLPAVPARPDSDLIVTGGGGVVAVGVGVADGDGDTESVAEVVVGTPADVTAAGVAPWLVHDVSSANDSAVAVIAVVRRTCMTFPPGPGGLRRYGRSTRLAGSS